MFIGLCQSAANDDQSRVENARHVGGDLAENATRLAYQLDAFRCIALCFPPEL
jgi:hypothetical protein